MSHVAIAPAALVFGIYANNTKRIKFEASTVHHVRTNEDLKRFPIFDQALEPKGG